MSGLSKRVHSFNVNQYEAGAIFWETSLGKCRLEEISLHTSKEERSIICLKV